MDSMVVSLVIIVTKASMGPATDNKSSSWINYLTGRAKQILFRSISLYILAYGPKHIDALLKRFPCPQESPAFTYC